jgi:hypothetical protein
MSVVILNLFLLQSQLNPYFSILTFLTNNLDSSAMQTEPPHSELPKPKSKELKPLCFIARNYSKRSLIFEISQP